MVQYGILSFAANLARTLLNESLPALAIHAKMLGCRSDGPDDLAGVPPVLSSVSLMSCSLLKWFLKFEVAEQKVHVVPDLHSLHLTFVLSFLTKKYSQILERPLNLIQSLSLSSFSAIITLKMAGQVGTISQFQPAWSENVMVVYYSRKFAIPKLTLLNLRFRVVG